MRRSRNFSLRATNYDSRKNVVKCKKRKNKTEMQKMDVVSVYTV